MEIMILENKFVFKNKYMIIKEINPPDKLYKKPLLSQNKEVMSK